MAVFKRIGGPPQRRPESPLLSRWACRAESANKGADGDRQGRTVSGAGLSDGCVRAQWRAVCQRLHRLFEAGQRTVRRH